MLVLGGQIFWPWEWGLYNPGYYTNYKATWKFNILCNEAFLCSSKFGAKHVFFRVVCPSVDYIMVRQEDKAKIRNVKVITSEECVQQQQQQSRLTALVRDYPGEPVPER